MEQNGYLISKMYLLLYSSAKNHRKTFDPIVTMYLLEIILCNNRSI